MMNTVIKRNLILKSTVTDPFFNIALGTYITRQYPLTECYSRIMLLCSSHRAVMLGRHQNMFKECDVELLHRDRVPVLRRMTGGGCTYVDRGNLLFGLVQPFENSTKTEFPVILKALRDLGLDAQLQGRNDIVLKGHGKVSGSAFSMDNHTFKHHGSVLVNVNKDHVQRYLTPDVSKLRSKGIASVRSRITNLTDIQPHLSVNTVSDSMCNSFIHHYGYADVAPIASSNHSLITDPILFQDILTQYKDPGFINNRNPHGFTHLFKHVFSFGLVECYLMVNVQHQVTQCQVFSDALDTRIAQDLQRCLASCCLKSPLEAQQRVTQICRDSSVSTQITEFVNWLRDTLMDKPLQHFELM